MIWDIIRVICDIEGATFSCAHENGLQNTITFLHFLPGTVFVFLYRFNALLPYNKGVDLLGTHHSSAQVFGRLHSLLP